MICIPSPFGVVSELTRAQALRVCQCLRRGASGTPMQLHLLTPAVLSSLKRYHPPAYRGTPQSRCGWRGVSHYCPREMLDNDWRCERVVTSGHMTDDKLGNIVSAYGN